MSGAGPDDRIVAHYGGSGLYDRIVAATGKAEAEIVASDIKGVDEFHIGGVEATDRLLDPLGLAPGTRVLDLGSGIGGPARRMAERYGWTVTGIDLTPDFVDTARRLTSLTGLQVEFVQGSALDLPFADASFDLATLIHVGMNLPDKPRLFAEAERVLRPNGLFAVYDVMMLDGRHPEFPVPWADAPAASFLDSPDAYRSAASAAGLELVAEAERTEVAKDFFARLAALVADGKVRVGLPLIMGADAGTKVQNMIAGIHAGQIAPIEMIFRKRAT